jgi:hypothetical protein
VEFSGATITSTRFLSLGFICFMRGVGNLQTSHLSAFAWALLSDPVSPTGFSLRPKKCLLRFSLTILRNAYQKSFLLLCPEIQNRSWVFGGQGVADTSHDGAMGNA